MRDRLIKIISDELGDINCAKLWAADIADRLLANGVIVPPCKVGDKVYYLDDIVWDDECRDCEHYFMGGFGDPSECGRTKYGNKYPDCIKIKEEVVTQHDIYYYLYAETFGKEVFLTKEQAEKALAGRSRP